MIRFLRRISFAAGLALLVGGWGATQYANKQQEHVSPDQRLDTWGAEIVRYQEETSDSISQQHRRLLKLLRRPKFTLTPSSTTYRNGVIAMAGGAFLVGLVLLRDGKNSGVELAALRRLLARCLGVLRWIGIVLLCFILAGVIATFISLCMEEM